MTLGKHAKGLGLTSIIVALLIGSSPIPQAAARAGGGRSVGRSSGSSYRRVAPPSHYEARPQTPPRMDAPTATPYQTRPPSSGGFFRNLAGGMAGGFLGSMLFSSLGHSHGGMGGDMAPSGGVGLIDLILLAGLAFIAWRWWQNRRQNPAPSMLPYTATYYREPVIDTTSAPARQLSRDRPTTTVINPEEASDVFFKIQGAWTRRDLSSARNVLADEMAEVLEKDLVELRSKHQVNRLENIAIRQVDVSDSWHENDADYCSVKFAANLLDYTVDEKSGQVVEGSDVQPVKFEENWVFAKTPNAANWQLAGIEQIQ